jgi:chemotaxis protein MotB
VEGGLVSNLGSVQVVTGKRPVVPETEDDDNPTPVQQRLYREGPPGIEERTEHQQTAAVPDTLSDPRETPGRAETAARPLPNAPPGAPRTGPAEARPPSEAELRAEIERRERESFERAAQQIREAVQSDPALAELARQLAIDITPEGLRIQLMDEERQPMFALGSAVPNERARALLAKIAPVLARLPLPVSIAGHTDATPYRGSERSNWELSAERANATRRVLTEAAMPEERIRRVTGHADRDLLLPGDPLAAANRRIAILVMHSARADAARTP